MAQKEQQALKFYTQAESELKNSSNTTSQEQLKPSLNQKEKQSSDSNRLTLSEIESLKIAILSFHQKVLVRNPSAQFVEKDFFNVSS